MRTELRRDVAAPAEHVWNLITDLSSTASLITGIESIEIVGGGDQLEIGSRWRETRTMFGKQSTEEIEVTAIDPGLSYTVVAESHSTRYRSVMSVAAIDDGSCTLGQTFDAEPLTFTSKVLAATIGRLFTGATKKALRQDLDDIAAVAEGD